MNLLTVGEIVDIPVCMSVSVRCHTLRKVTKLQPEGEKKKTAHLSLSLSLPDTDLCSCGS